MKKIGSLIISLVVVVLMTVSSFGASAVPKEVLDASESVVRIFAGQYSGTGFVVAQDDDNTYIATNYHVIEDDPKGALVWLSEESNINASVLVSDKGKDLCILKIAFPLGLEPIKLSENGAQKGDAIYAVGYPGAADSVGVEYALDSESSTITDGIVSSVKRGPVTSGGSDVDILQVSAAINPGNSGGPIFNEKGVAVGVSTFGINDSQGIFGAVAISELKDILDSKGIEYVTDITPEKSFPAWLYVVIGIVVSGIIATVVVILVKNSKKKKVEQTEWTFVGGKAVDETNGQVMYSEPKKTINWGKVVGISAGALAIVFIATYIVTYTLSVKAADEFRFRDAYNLLLVKPITSIHDGNHVAYVDAGETMNRSNYEAAKVEFEGLGEYKYSKDLSKECDYQIAKSKMNKGDYEGALICFQSLLQEGDYRDARELYNELECEMVVSKWDGESSILKIIKNLSDLEDGGNELAEEYKGYFKEIVYTKAVDMYHEGNYIENYEMFRELNDYKDSDKYCKLCDAKQRLDKIDINKLGGPSLTGNVGLDALNAKYGLNKGNEDTKVVNIARDVEMLIPFEDSKDIYNYCKSLVDF